MLERASICVENVAQHLLRPIESPLRSSRLLPHTFWKYTRARDDSTSVAWWPAYLEHLRHASSSPLSCTESTQHPWANGCSASSSFGNVQFRGGRPRDRRRAARHRSSGHDRAYVQPGGRLQQQAVRRVIDYNSKLDDGNGTFHTAEPDGQDERRESAPLPDAQVAFESENVNGSHGAILTNDSVPHDPTPEESLDEALSRDRIDDRDEIWSLYSSISESNPFSERMLKHLASSSRSVDTDRAIRVFFDIPEANRSENDYQYVMEAIIMRGDIQLADSVNRMALSRSAGINSSRILLTYLIRQELWPEAAKAWGRICAAQTELHPSPQLQVDGASDNKPHVQKWAMWADVDAMLDLPRKLAVLGRRFHDTEMPFGSDTKHLKRLAKVLLTRAFASTRIMAVLTGDGFVALVKQLRRIGICNEGHHIKAISALNDIRHTRPRPRLALLVYRNLRCHFPKGKVLERTYGSLLSILATGGAPAEDLLFVLKEFSSMHGKPDRKAYQLVLTSCARLGNLNRVLDVFKLLCKDYGKPRDLAYLTPLLYVHARLGDVKIVQSLLDNLEKDYGLRPDTYCWNILLAAHARTEDPLEAFTTFDEMRRRGIHPDSYSFGTLMGICAANGDTEALHKLVELARAYQVSGTYPMVDTLVESYCNNDEVENAENLAETATPLELEGSPTRMWNIILLHYAYRADYEAVLRIQERMRELSVKPDGSTYAALMTTLVTIGRTDDAAKILRSLHLSERLSASLFHHSIILHGYAREGNRDMVAVIYHEIIERFQRPSVSARLSMLHAESQREIKNWQASNLHVREKNSTLIPPRFPKTTTLLANIIAEIDRVDLTTKDPQPGLQRRSPTLAVPLIYIEFVSRTLNLHFAFRDAVHLLSRCQAVLRFSSLSYTPKGASSIQLLTIYMIGCVRQKSFGPVEETWQEIMSLAKSRIHHSASDLVLGEEELWPSTPLTMASGSINVDPGDRFSDPSSFSNKEEDVRVLPSQRYILSRPLSQYLQALRLQKQFKQIPQVVDDLQRQGFALSSKNWNTYIQTLTQSPETKHKLHAFELFEAQLLPNMPPWQVLRRRSWLSKIKPDNVEWNQVRMAGRERQTRPELVPRSLLETLRSNQLVPTYFTLVYLASALIDFRRRESRGEPVSTKMVWHHAPGTYRVLMRLPYLRDRVQGLLLRERLLQGDPLAQPRQGPRANRSLVLGDASEESISSQGGADESAVPNPAEITSNTESNDNQKAVAFVSDAHIGEPDIRPRRPEPEKIAENRRRRVLKIWSSAPQGPVRLLTSEREKPTRPLMKRRALDRTRIPGRLSREGRLERLRASTTVNKRYSKRWNFLRWGPVPLLRSDPKGPTRSMIKMLVRRRTRDRIPIPGKLTKKRRLRTVREFTKADKQLLIKTIPPRGLSNREVNAFSTNKARKARKRRLTSLWIVAGRSQQTMKESRNLGESSNPSR